MVLVTLVLLTPEYFSRYTKAALLFWSFRVVLKSLTDYIRCRYKNCIAIKINKRPQKASALSEEHYEKGTRH